MTPTLPKRLDSIQCLSALTSGIWDRGWAGVDLFFVISGFIMVYVTRETGRSFGDVRRLRVL